MAATMAQKPASGPREPAWEIARLFPDQGFWSEEDYLDLETNQLVEFTDGRIEVLPMPKTSHQYIVVILFELLREFVRAGKMGNVILAPLRVKLRPAKFREPDIVFMSRENKDRIHEDFWDGADLLMEVVSDDPESRKRDLIRKRRDYAEAQVREYWIVDPAENRITVLKLQGKRYVTHGRFGPGERASSALLKGFSVDVADVLGAAEREIGE